jgi:hypothetical protein
MPLLALYWLLLHLGSRSVTWFCRSQSPTDELQCQDPGIETATDFQGLLDTFSLVKLRGGQEVRLRGS